MAIQPEHTFARFASLHLAVCSSYHINGSNDTHNTQRNSSLFLSSWWFKPHSRPLKLARETNAVVPTAADGGRCGDSEHVVSGGQSKTAYFPKCRTQSKVNGNALAASARKTESPNVPQSWCTMPQWVGRGRDGRTGADREPGRVEAAHNLLLS